MCIAILNKTGIIDKATLQICWSVNNDGAGFTFHNGEKIIIYKELKNFNKFYKAYITAKKQNNVAFAIHFRISTSGLVNLENCHPFKVNDNISFIHNGIIPATDYIGNFSDTYNFNEIILKELPANWYNNKAILTMISEFIGYSKLIFIIKNKYLIINETKGHWQDGNWYSNDSYKKVMLKEYDRYFFGSGKNYNVKPDLCEYCATLSKLIFNYSYNSYLCEQCNKSLSSYSYNDQLY